MEFVTRERRPAPLEERSAPLWPADPARARGDRHGLLGHAANLGQLLGSHAVVAAAGLASLPILARNLGPEAYGRFSLFVLALGLLSSLDVARPILVRELSRASERSRGAEAPRGVGPASLTATSAWILAGASALLGLAIGGPLVAATLAAAVFLHALTAIPFAALSAEGRVGAAGSIRNVCQASALGAVVVLSFSTRSAHAWIWPFVAANLLVLALSARAASGARIRLRPPSVDALWSYRTQASDVLVFALASAVVVAYDRFLLDATADAAAFGRYAAQYDLAVKLNIVSTALGTVLYPSFSRAFAREDALAAAQRFVGIASRVVLVYFALILALIVFHAPVARLVLGAELGGGGAGTVYPVLLVGVFVHIFGFLITPYQRAHGDFRTHRRAYVGAALVMLVVGAFAVPRFGVMGALVTYLSGRTAELALVIGAVRTLPAGAIGRRHVVTLALMLTALAVAAALAATGRLEFAGVWGGKS